VTRQHVTRLALASTALIGAVTAVLIALAGCGGPSHTQRIVAERDGGFVDVFVTGGRQRIEVHSPKGIGAATLALDPRIPRDLELVFYLQALERLRCAYNDIVIELQIDTSGDVHERLMAGTAGSRPLAPTDSLYMPVQIVHRPNRDPARAVESIHVRAAPALQRTPADSLRLEWVDFFR
jgi:hypothetical protein